MPTVSANRSSTEKKTLQDILQDNIDSTRKQQRTEIVRTVKHLNRSLDVLVNNGYGDYVQDFCGEFEMENTEDWNILHLWKFKAPTL
jgi:short-subunit dehydrogenase involved in D-alanine esterification of teichoic acids